MAFEATKKEWSELYAVTRLLADGCVYAGTADAGRNELCVLPVAMLRREEHDGTRRYIVGHDSVHIVGEAIDKRVSRDAFRQVADSILTAMKQGTADMVESPEGVEAFWDEILLYDLEARTEDRTDFHLSFYTEEVPPEGFCVRSRIGRLVPLLDGGRTANFKFEQSGIRFASPTVNKINALRSANEVADRILMIERLGGVLKYSDVADKVFRSNLSMIDLHFPRLMAEMVRTMHLDGITRVSELTERMCVVNPLKIKDELIRKHGFYEFKMKQFLKALAFGMRPAKLYNGTDSAVAGFVFVDGDGQLLCYRKADGEVFGDFLFRNSRLEKGSLEKDKYGFLERENGVYYLKLNLKIGLLKR